MRFQQVGRVRRHMGNAHGVCVAGLDLSKSKKGSIIRGCSSGVERLPSKQGVVGSIPTCRSIFGVDTVSTKRRVRCRHAVSRQI